MLRAFLCTTAILAVTPTTTWGQELPGSGRDPVLLAELGRPAPTDADVRLAMDALDYAAELRNADEFVLASEALAPVAELLPTLTEWISLIQAEAIAETGDTTATYALIAAVDADSDLHARFAWLPEARALEVAGAPSRAKDVARAAAHRLEGEGERSLAWLRTGQLAALAGDEPAARQAFVNAIQADRGSKHASRAADDLAALGGLNAVESYSVARVRVIQGEWRQAIAGLSAAPDVDGLASEDRYQAGLDLGRAYFFTKQYATAETAFQAIVEDDGTPGPFAARALYFVGRSAYRQGRRTEGREALEAVAVRYPDARAARDALYLLADLDHDAGRMTDALRYYEDILDLAPTTREADLAGMRLGSWNYQNGALTDAAEIFDRRRAEAGSTDSQQQASFWAAIAYHELGRDDLALERLTETYEADPLSYYGSQAAAQIDAPLLTEELADGPTTPEMEALTGPLSNAVARLLVHMKVPTPGSFAFELERIKDHFGTYQGGRYALAEALIAGGLPIQGIVAGREIQRAGDGWDLRLLRIIYPFPHRAVILREAERRRVNPYLAAGLIRQESMFDEDIKSRAGAIGMMQVMPATGAELARGVGIDGYSTARLAEADVNVTLGMTFLSEMLERYDGAVVDALVAYNAGPTRIRRWRNMPEYQDQNLFTERIPFRETREYVKVVQRNALIYESLYGCDGESPCLGTSPTQVRGLVESDAPEPEPVP